MARKTISERKSELEVVWVSQKLLPLIDDPEAVLTVVPDEVWDFVHNCDRALDAIGVRSDETDEFKDIAKYFRTLRFAEFWVLGDYGRYRIVSPGAKIAPKILFEWYKLRNEHLHTIGSLMTDRGSFFEFTRHTDINNFGSDVVHHLWFDGRPFISADLYAPSMFDAINTLV